MATLRVRVLGAVELRTPGGDLLPVAGAKRRAALAVLALDINRTVPVERFLSALWEEAPPPQAKAALQGHIAALRKALAGSPLTVETRPAGYALVGAADQVDAHRFDALLSASGRAGGDEGRDLLGEALGLWRGPALSGLPNSRWVRDRARLLDQARLTALESWARASIEAGHAESAVPVLESAVALDPLREPLAALLIRALGRSGRRAQALEVHRRTAEALAGALGTSPGEVLREALRAVTGPAAAPGAAVGEERGDTYLVPRLLPRPMAGYVERAEERAWLDRLVPGEGGPTAQVAIVAGAAGSGKTSLVTCWAHTVADRFPDGRLYGDLRGFSTNGPADAGDLLHAFLRAMGVREDEIPDQAEERARLYRERTRDRALLVILDNALSARDIELLLPDGSASVTVVCSRHVLNELIVREAAAFLPVGPFSADAAEELVVRRIGPARATADQAASRRLAELCGHLPLALSIALARLTARPDWSVADIVTELEDERVRLSGLGTPGAIGVARELALSRRQLPPEGARLMPLIALHPATEIDALSAAALLGQPRSTGRRALDALAALHLVNEAGPGRYQVHDLIRLYCLHLLNEEVPQDEQDQAVARLADYYLAATASANVLVSGREHGQHGGRADPDGLPRHRDIREALRWLGREENSLRALVVRCADTGQDERAWRLADNVTGLFLASGAFGSWLDCATAGLRAARRSTDPAALPRMRASLGFALKEMNRLDEAVRHLRQALAENPADDPLGQVRTLVPLAGAYLELGELEDSRRYARRALDDARAAGDPWSEAYALHVVCFAELRHGSAARALQHARRALGLLAGKPIGHARMAAMACEAIALGRLRRAEEAEAAWITLIELSTRQGNDHVRSIVEGWYAELLLGLGRRKEAADQLRSAIELYRRREDGRSVAALTRRLEELG